MSIYTLNQTAAAALTTGNSVTYFWPLNGQLRLYIPATDAPLQAPVRTAGTLSRLLCRFSIAPSAPQTINFRNNGANGSMVISPPGSGFTFDTSHTDSIALGDLVNYAMTVGATGISSAPSTVGTTFAPTAGASILSVATALTVSTGVAIGTTTAHFTQLSGDCNSAVTAETLIGVRFMPAGTAKNAFANIVTNTSTTNLSCKLRTNQTTDTVVVALVIAGNTGQFEDTSHSVSLPTDTVLDYHTTGASSGSSVAMASCGLWVDYVGGSTTDLLCCTADVTGGATYSSSTGNRFLNCYGALVLNSGTNEPNVALGNPGFYATWSNLRIRVSTNTLTANATMSARVNSATGNQATVITLGVIGSYEDTSHQDSLNVGDLINVMFVGATGITGSAHVAEITGGLTTGQVPNKQIITIHGRHDVEDAPTSRLATRKYPVQRHYFPPRRRTPAHEEEVYRPRARFLYPIQPTVVVVTVRPFVYVQT